MKIFSIYIVFQAYGLIELTHLSHALWKMNWQKDGRSQINPEYAYFIWSLKLSSEYCNHIAKRKMLLSCPTMSTKIIHYDFRKIWLRVEFLLNNSLIVVSISNNFSIDMEKRGVGILKHLGRLEWMHIFSSLDRFSNYLFVRLYILGWSVFVYTFVHLPFLALSTTLISSSEGHSFIH